MPVPAALTRFDADALGVFLAVAEHGGALPAARAIGRSQPAVSERVRQLEASLGTALFRRSPRGMTLTPAGAELVGYARRIGGLLAEAHQAVAGRAELAAGRLVLAASTTPAAFVLAPLLAEFGRQRLLHGIELRVGNTDEILALVREGVVPLGIVEGPGRAAGVSLQHFRHDEILPVFAPDRVAPELRRAAGAVRTASELAALPLLWRESGSGTRRVVETAFRAAGVPARGLRFDIVLGGTLALKAGALAGLGIAFLPRCAITQELVLGQLQPIASVRGLRITRQFSWALPSGGVPEILVDFMRFARKG
ncbi:MAG TPA: LysR family transcriptional regulator [Candidatus Didemnitutus sp.]|jgi:DNA-binding transcriptional LysR family regulator